MGARFNLSEFVLGYLEEAGSVVMPPEFGVYEVLMPEEVADSLSLDDHTFALAFAPAAPSEQADAALRLSVNHPLVESIAQTITRQPANARTFVRGVRTDKQGLAELARQHLGLANARIDELPETQEEAAPASLSASQFQGHLAKRGEAGGTGRCRDGCAGRPCGG